MENGMQLTLDEYAPQIFREQTAGASDFLARTSVQQESKKDFRATVQVCFSELCILSDSSKKKENPLSFSSKTLEICLALMTDGTSPGCSLKWTKTGTMRSGKFSTPKISEHPKTERGCSLSDILEGDAPVKYFLSREQTEKIMLSKSEG